MTSSCMQQVNLIWWEMSWITANENLLGASHSPSPDYTGPYDAAGYGKQDSYSAVLSPLDSGEEDSKVWLDAIFNLVAIPDTPKNPLSKKTKC